jgi:hypothetical protein
MSKYTHIKYGIYSVGNSLSIMRDPPESISWGIWFYSKKSKTGRYFINTDWDERIVKNQIFIYGLLEEYLAKLNEIDKAEK